MPRVRSTSQTAHKRRFAAIRAKYGLTEVEFYAMFYLQDKACAICKSEFDESLVHGIHIDHCHKSNVIRGLLCGDCNLSLGRIEVVLDSSLEGWQNYLANNAQIPIPYRVRSTKPGRRPIIRSPAEAEIHQERNRLKHADRQRKRRSAAKAARIKPAR